MVRTVHIDVLEIAGIGNHVTQSTEGVRSAWRDGKTSSVIKVNFQFNQYCIMLMYK